jgi:hypothetical protein
VNAVPPAGTPLVWPPVHSLTYVAAFAGLTAPVMAGAGLFVTAKPPRPARRTR